jgi:hypothetical protein
MLFFPILEYDKRINVYDYLVRLIGTEVPFALEILVLGAPTVYGYLKRTKLVGTQLLSNTYENVHLTYWECIYLAID